MKVKGVNKGPLVANKNWCILVGERTQRVFYGFYDKKSNMMDPTCEQTKRWKDTGLPVKYIRCSNARENLILEKHCKGTDYQMNIRFEYTARATTHQNHLAELKLPFLANKGR